MDTGLRIARGAVASRQQTVGTVSHRQARGVGVGAPGVYAKPKDAKVRDSNKNTSVQHITALNCTVHQHAPGAGSTYIPSKSSRYQIKKGNSTILT